MKLLIIGAEVGVCKDISLSMRLRWPEATVECEPKGSKGIVMIAKDCPDLAVVEFSLLDMNALDLLSDIRHFSDLPLIILVSSGNAMDGIRALDMGADDYVVKPVNIVDLLMRIVALLRRFGRNGGFERKEKPFANGHVTVDFTGHEVFVSGKPVKLTPKEYKLLSELARNDGRVVTSRALLRRVWGEEYVSDVPFLKKYVYRLRSKLELDPSRPSLILNERGIGYKIAKTI